MARYGKETPLTPKRVILLAREHFGPDGPVGLPITKETWNEVTFEGGGGSVSVTAMTGTPDRAASARSRFVTGVTACEL
jgi:hypothetical protein